MPRAGGPKPRPAPRAAGSTRIQGMGPLTRRSPPSKGRILAARLVAVGVDFAQIVAFPFFLGGAASPLTDALDLLTAGIMVWLLGWHWAFAPTILAELVPIVDLFPTWTTAVLYVTWGKSAKDVSDAPDPPEGTRSLARPTTLLPSEPAPGDPSQPAPPSPESPRPGQPPPGAPPSLDP